MKTTWGPLYVRLGFRQGDPLSTYGRLIAATVGVLSQLFCFVVKGSIFVS